MYELNVDQMDRNKVVGVFQCESGSTLPVLLAGVDSFNN